MPLDIVERPEDLTTEWMTAALRAAGCLPEGEVNDFSFEVIGTGKMGDNARIQLSYDRATPDAPASVIAKFPAEDETARAIAGIQGAYYTEVMFYRHLAPHTSMRTPHIYANEVSEDRLSFITVMEDMSPAAPGSQLVGESLEHTRIAAEQAARFAAAFYGDEAPGRTDYVLTQARDDGGAFGAQLLEQQWPGFLERFGDQISQECRAFGEQYVLGHQAFITRYKGPKTVAHGDFRSENMLFDQDRMCTVDWQTVLETSPLADLAYFMGGSLEVDDRRNWERDVVSQYSEHLGELGVRLDADECWEQYCEQAMHGLMITILGASFSEPAERSDAMFLTMIQRHLQHCVDLDSSRFLVGA